jgi:branched-subunit amino acid transport protein
VINEIVLILGMMAVTFGIRYFLFAFSGKIKMEGILKKSLDYIPPAVLTAITIPALLIHNDKIFFSYENTYLAAGIAALIAGIISRNLLITICIGLAVFFTYSYFI